MHVKAFPSDKGKLTSPNENGAPFFTSKIIEAKTEGVLYFARSARGFH